MTSEQNAEAQLKEMLEVGRVPTPDEIHKLREINRADLNPKERATADLNQFSVKFIQHVCQFYLDTTKKFQK